MKCMCTKAVVSALSLTLPLRITAFSTKPNYTKLKIHTHLLHAEKQASPIKKPNPDANLTPVERERLEETFGGYTVKQRLREEVESPFRKARLLFFGASGVSALIALYFSALSTIKAYAGGFSDAPPLEEALANCGINLVGVIGFALLAFRDYKVGQANLERIAKGGKLAKLTVVSGND